MDEEQIINVAKQKLEFLEEDRGDNFFIRFMSFDKFVKGHLANNNIFGEANMGFSFSEVRKYNSDSIISFARSITNWDESSFGARIYKFLEKIFIEEIINKNRGKANLKLREYVLLALSRKIQHYSHSESFFKGLLDNDLEESDIKSITNFINDKGNNEYERDLISSIFNLANSLEGEKLNRETISRILLGMSNLFIEKIQGLYSPQYQVLVFIKCDRVNYFDQGFNNWVEINSSPLSAVYGVLVIFPNKDLAKDIIQAMMETARADPNLAFPVFSVRNNRSAVLSFPK